MSNKKSFDENINPMELSVENRGDTIANTDFNDSKCESNVLKLDNLQQVIRDQHIDG